MRTYAQLSLDERYQIQTLLKQGQSIPKIAASLGRSASTVYREVARNSTQGYVEPYRAQRAQRITNARRIKKGEAQRKIQGELKELVESKLRLSWSPEQIAGRLRLEENIHLSHETIYQHILRDTKRLGFYRYCLRFGGYKQHRFKKSRHAARTRARKNRIEDRPAAANDRTEIGHWERDCLLGKRGESAMLTMVDRRSRYLRIMHVPRLDTASVAAATQVALRRQPAKTLTNDNGIEFQRDSQLQDKLSIPIYFCNPSSPWERGTVENTNGLLRQYLPRGSSFDSIDDLYLHAVENTLNHRPRKVLGFRTPHEIYKNTQLKMLSGDQLHFGLEFSSAS